MSLLSQRLTQLRKQAGQQVIEQRKTSAERNLAERLKHAQVSQQSLASQKITDQQLADALGAKVLAEGVIYLRQQQNLNKIHGSYDASQLIGYLAQWPEPLPDKHPQSLLFIDTETTGLSGGTGTIAFLLGVSEIQGQTLINHQLLLNGFQGEKALLQWFNEKLANKSSLVSYNGKSFDVPLLVSRFRLHGMASPLLTLHHVDLLHWMRRMYQKYWPDCRLQTAEQYCLQFFRKDDLPGSEAPEVWTELIRFGRVERLTALCRHHCWDVLSLIALLDFAAKQVSCHSEQEFNVFATANFLVKQKRTLHAKLLLERNQQSLCSSGLYLLAMIYRREKNWSQALSHLETLAEQAFEPALEALAKYYEHKEKDYETALVLTRNMINLSSRLKHEKRLLRLQRKSVAKKVDALRLSTLRS